MKYLTPPSFLALCALTLMTHSAVAQNTSTFKYDGKGRLVEVDNGDKFVAYAYDKANNRKAVGNERLDELTQAVITKFEVPSMAFGLGDNTPVVWESLNTDSCALSFENQITRYNDLPSSGNLMVRVFTSGAIFLTCENATERVETSSYIFYQSGGGGPIEI